MATPRAGVRTRAPGSGLAAMAIAAERRARPSALRLGLPQHLVRVDAERAGDGDEVGDVDVAGAGLLAEHEAGRAAEALRELSLRQTP